MPKSKKKNRKTRKYHFVRRSCPVVSGAIEVFVALVLLVDAFFPVATRHEPLILWSTLFAAVGLIRCYHQSLKRIEIFENDSLHSKHLINIQITKPTAEKSNWKKLFLSVFLTEPVKTILLFVETKKLLKRFIVYYSSKHAQPQS